MMSSEIRINGTLISSVYIHCLTRDTEIPIREYEWEIYRPGSGYVIAGRVRHRHAEGAERLLSKVLQSYTRKCRGGEMADAAVSKSAARKSVRVQIPPSVPGFTEGELRALGCLP